MDGVKWQIEKPGVDIKKIIYTWLDTFILCCQSFPLHPISVMYTLIPLEQHMIQQWHHSAKPMRN
jgi:hypothetical protein